jgi:hypothetical protein
MSEYQYYAFQAVDRPLSVEDRKALRALSTRARITATNFTNSYEWGDFKGSPDELMARWFDLHLYLANWGARRLMIRFPARLIDMDRVGKVIDFVECASVTRAVDYIILDVWREDVETDDDWDDGSGWLGTLAQLRSDMLGGDLRLFHLLWLVAVEDGDVEDDMSEPLPGLGPMTGALQGFAQFFGIDTNLIAAAAEQSEEASGQDKAASDTLRRYVEELPEAEKTAFLLRLVEGDLHVAGEIRAKSRDRLKSTSPARSLRRAGELRQRARAIAAERKRAEEERRQAELQRKDGDVARTRRAHIDALKRLGESVWGDIEANIERRNASGYDTAAALLHDMKALAEEQGAMTDFSRRLGLIRERHTRKERFIERLNGLL